MVALKNEYPRDPAGRRVAGWSMLCRLIVLGVGGLASASPSAALATNVPAAESQDERPDENPDARLEDVEDVEERGRQALAAARQARRSAYELEGEARALALLEAAKVYGEACADDTLSAAHRAEAAFRAGEILRSQDQLDDAAERFGQATTLAGADDDGGARSFAARGVLELGHLRRRADDAGGALEHYEQVWVRFSDQRRACAHARTWSGKLLIRQGRLDEASEAMLDFDVYLPDYPLEAIRNVELMGTALVEQGRGEAAKEALTRLEEKMAPLLKDGGMMAARLASALTDVRGTVGGSGY